MADVANPGVWGQFAAAAEAGYATLIVDSDSMWNNINAAGSTGHGGGLEQALNTRFSFGVDSGLKAIFGYGVACQPFPGPSNEWTPGQGPTGQKRTANFSATFGWTSDQTELNVALASEVFPYPYKNFPGQAPTTGEGSVAIQPDGTTSGSFNDEPLQVDTNPGHPIGLTDDLEWHVALSGAPAPNAGYVELTARDEGGDFSVYATKVVNVIRPYGVFLDSLVIPAGSRDSQGTPLALCFFNAFGTDKAGEFVIAGNVLENTTRTKGPGVFPRVVNFGSTAEDLETDGALVTQACHDLMMDLNTAPDPAARADQVAMLLIETAFNDANQGPPVTATDYRNALLAIIADWEAKQVAAGFSLGNCLTLITYIQQPETGLNPTETIYIRDTLIPEWFTIAAGNPRVCAIDPYSWKTGDQADADGWLHTDDIHPTELGAIEFWNNTFAELDAAQPVAGILPGPFSGGPFK